MIKRHNPLIFICTFYILAFTSCKKDGVLEASDTSSILQNDLESLVSQVKLWHDSTVRSKLSAKVQNGIIAFSVNENDIVPPKVDWEKAFINYDSSSVKSITIPISMNHKNGEHMQLVATKSKNKLNGYFIKVTPDSSYFAKQDNIFNYSNFSGSVTIYSLMGVRLKKQDFKTSVVSQSNNTSETGLSNYTTHGDGFNSAIDLLEVTVISTKRKKYRFYGYDYGYFLIEVVNYIENDEFGSGIVIAGGDAPAGKVDDIKINISDPCISIVINDIISKDKQNEVMSYINSAFGFNENCNMNFSSVKNLTNKLGEFVSGHSSITRYKDSLIVNVQINSDSNNSKEFIAATILHEMIHGYLASQNIPQNKIEEVIADSLYIGWMSSSLISLFPNLSPTDANALALGGLEATSYYNSLSNEIKEASRNTNGRHRAGNEGQKCK
jgi:hypothetical protein